MGACVECNKTGLLVSVDANGLCKKCAAHVLESIRHPEAVPFYLALQASQREAVRQALSQGDISRCQALLCIGRVLVSQEAYAQAEPVLTKVVALNEDILYVHEGYSLLIELCYKQREDPRYLKLCEEYCAEDIRLFRHYKDRLPKEHGALPVIPSFKRLVIIYEKQGRLKEAIKVCDWAVKNRLRDGAKGGFEARLSGLRTKLEAERK